MARIIRLTESDLTRLVRKVIEEQMPIRSTYRSNPKYNSTNMSQKIDKNLMGCRTNPGTSKMDINQIKNMVSQMISAMDGVGTDEDVINKIFYNIELNGTFGDLCMLQKIYDQFKGDGKFQKLISTGRYEDYEIIPELDGPDSRIPIYNSIENIYNKWFKEKK
jgi:hypothetical protein